jgi:glycosyltransferase involved in cell wall biosynthesis
MAATVLHVIETGGPGGAEQMMVHLAAGLGSEYRSEAALIRDSWLGTALQKRGVPVTMLRSGFEGSFATLRNLMKLIRQRRVAILHTHEFFMNTLGLVASRLTGVPVVATVHGKNYYSERFRRRLAYRLVGRSAGQMVAVSDDVREFLVEQVGIPSNRIRVVRNGVPVNGQSSHERLSTLRERLGLDQNARVVGTVGSLYPVKGHKYLIDAAVHVVRRCPDVTFLIVGRGRLREELEAQASGLGVAPYIRFLGHRDDVRDLLDVCDAFVLPSLSEGMPLALLEAMAAGVPTVATRVGGVGEVLEDGKSGLLVPPGESHAVAESLVTLLEDRTLATEIGEFAREVVARRYSLEGMVQAYQEVYAGIIRKPEPIGVRR